MLLNTLPFNTFNNTILEPLTDYDKAKIVLLPTYYLYWVGGTLWRYLEYQKTSQDPIDWGNSNVSRQFYVEIDKFMHTIGNQAGYKPYTEEESEIGDNLLQLPTNIKEKLINYFIRWVESETSNADNFSNFETIVKAYSDAADINLSKGPANKLLRLLKGTEKVVIVAPEIFLTNTFTDGLYITRSELKTYMDAFMDEYELENDVYHKEIEEQQVKTKDILKDNDMKLSVL